MHFSQIGGKFAVAIERPARAKRQLQAAQVDVVDFDVAIERPARAKRQLAVSGRGPPPHNYALRITN